MRKFLISYSLVDSLDRKVGRLDKKVDSLDKKVSDILWFAHKTNPGVVT